MPKRLFNLHERLEIKGRWFEVVCLTRRGVVLARSVHPAIRWNPGNKVVQDHRNGEIDHHRTNVERARRGLPVPWVPEMGDRETRLPDMP